MISTRRKIGLAAAAVVALLVASCSKGAGSIEKHISKDASFVLLVPNLEKAVKDLDSFMTWAAAKTPIIAMGKQSLINQAGFDVTNVEELGKRGFDPKGGLAFVMLDPKTSDGYMVMSITSKDDFVAFINEGLKKEGKPEMKKEGDVYDLDGSVMMFKKKWVFVADNKATIEKAQKVESISGVDAYKTAFKSVGSDNDAFIYMSPDFMKSAAMKSEGLPAESAKAIDTVSKMYGAMGVGLKLANGDISANTYIEILDLNRVKKLMAAEGGAPTLDKFPEGASLIAKTHVNIAEVWNFMKEFLAATDPTFTKQMETGLAEANGALGIDVEADLIGNLEGNPVVAYYGYAGKAPDLVVSVSLKDEAKIKEALAKFAQMATGKPPVGDVIEFPIGPNESMFMAVADKRLYISTTADRLNATLSGSGSKLVDGVPHADAKTLLGDDEQDVLYVNIGGLLKAIKSGLDPQTAQMMNMYVAQVGGLDDAFVLVSSKLVAKGIVGGIKIHLGN